MYKYNFASKGDLYYHLLITECGFGINRNQYLYDQDTGEEFQFKDLKIKVATNNLPIYAGKTDVIFCPEENYSLMRCLFGVFLDKIQEDPDTLFRYIADGIDWNEDKSKQRIFVRTSLGDIYTRYYYNAYLGFIEAIFLLNQLNSNGGNINALDYYAVNIEAFDIIDENK